MNDAPLTPEELLKAAQYLAGIATQQEKQGHRVVTMPTATVRRLADALLSAVNGRAA